MKVAAKHTKKIIDRFNIIMNRAEEKEETKWNRHWLGGWKAEKKEEKGDTDEVEQKTESSYYKWMYNPKVLTETGKKNSMKAKRKFMN